MNKTIAQAGVIVAMGWPCAAPEARKDLGPRKLPILNCNGIDYFIDARLKQFREVSNPHHSVEFDSEQGCEMGEGITVAICPYCGETALLAQANGKDTVPCRRCAGLYRACGKATGGPCLRKPARAVRGVKRERPTRRGRGGEWIWR